MNNFKKFFKLNVNYIFSIINTRNPFFQRFRRKDDARFVRTGLSKLNILVDQLVDDLSKYYAACTQRQGIDMSDISWQ